MAQDEERDKAGRFSRYVSSAMKRGLSGSAAGRAAKSDALTNLVGRRVNMRNQMRGTGGGTIQGKMQVPSQSEMDELIEPGSTKRRR